MRVCWPIWLPPRLGKLYLRTAKQREAQEHVATATAMCRDMGMQFWLEQAEAKSHQLQQSSLTLPKHEDVSAAGCSVAGLADVTVPRAGRPAASHRKQTGKSWRVSENVRDCEYYRRRRNHP